MFVGSDCRIKANCLLVGPGPVRGCPPWGVFLRDPIPYGMRVSEKISKNSKRLGQQARPEFVPGTSRLPVLSVTILPLVGPVHTESGAIKIIENTTFYFYEGIKNLLHNY